MTSQSRQRPRPVPLRLPAHLAQDGEVVSRDIHNLTVLAQVVPAGAVRRVCGAWAEAGGRA